MLYSTHQGVVLALALNIASLWMPARVSAQQPITVDDESRFQFEELYSAPIYAFRAFPVELFNQPGIKENNAQIDAGVFLEAASKSVAVQQRLEQMGVLLGSATLGQIAQASAEIASSDVYPVTSTVQVSPESDDVWAMLAKEEGFFVNPKRYDTNFILQSLNTEIIDQSIRTQWDDVRLSNIDEIPVDWDFASKVSQAYKLLRMNEGMQPQLVMRTFEEIDNSLGMYVAFSGAAKVALGSVSVGRPIIMTAEEAGLSVPEGLQRVYDFYLVLFAISIREDFDFVESVNFSVSMPEGCVAFDLFPLRYGLEVQVKEEFAVPGASVEAKSVKVSFSSIFKQTLQYNTLKPTILGYGLQESEFAWSFRDEAARMGSQRVAAILGVPKTHGDVPYTTGVYVKTEPSFLAEGDVASSIPKTNILISN